MEIAGRSKYEDRAKQERARLEAMHHRIREQERTNFPQIGDHQGLSPAAAAAAASSPGYDSSSSMGGYGGMGGGREDGDSRFKKKKKKKKKKKTRSSREESIDYVNDIQYGLNSRSSKASLSSMSSFDEDSAQEEVSVMAPIHEEHLIPDHTAISSLLIAQGKIVYFYTIHISCNDVDIHLIYICISIYI